ncbi:MULTISPECIES: hypothetical protein [unclassified Rhizobium]|uniref:hypothetical protein n=1 Tax=unclassified Rhizobium TaxID=2613769 RepID=UPI0012E27F22|nr:MULTISPECIES: hypothetical protein [unclassified Rhizobium]
MPKYLRFIKTPVLVKGAAARRSRSAGTSSRNTGISGSHADASASGRDRVENCDGSSLAIKPARQHPVLSSEFITARYQAGTGNEDICTMNGKEKPPHLTARRFYDGLLSHTSL